MSDLFLFSFEEKQVRTVMVDGEPYFVGSDVATLLGYKRPNDTITQHCRGYVKSPLPTNSGEQEMLVIPEQDVYRLIFRSKLPSAQKFEDWVVGVVLPQIRKTGKYEAPMQSMVPMTYKEALKAHLETLEKMEAQGVELQKANDHIALLQHTGKLFTATEIAKEMGMSSANELNRLLEERGVQYKVNNTWVLRSWYADKGYTSIKQMEMENGKVIYDRKWTQAGRDFILQKLSQPVTKSLTTKIEE